MTWQVTYRAKDGKRAYEYFEAGSKQELFAILKQKQISAISIVEAKSGSRIRNSKRSSVNPLSVKLVAIIVLLLIAVPCGFLFFVPCEEQSVATDDKKPRPKHVSLTFSEVQSPQSAVTEKRPAEKEEPSYIVVDGRRVYRSSTNDVGRVVTNAFGKTMVIERVVKPDGPMKDGQSLVPRRIFKYDSEVAIDTLMNMDIGYKSLMMLPANMDKDFQESLSAEIEILPEDSEDEVRRKREMINLKKELAQRVANGEKVSQIAAETLAHYNKIAEMRETLLQEIIKCENEGASSEELEEIHEAANAMLKEYDALPIHSPKVRKAIIRERLERNKARRMQQY